MKTRRIRATTVVVAAWAMAASIAVAAQAGGVRHVSGGVGQAQQQQLAQAAGAYSLGLTFATRTGQYLADVQVSIRDARGDEVLATTSEGPLMWVDLPAGRYDVQARYQGQTRENQVEIPAQGQRRLVLRWDTGSR